MTIGNYRFDLFVGFPSQTTLGYKYDTGTVQGLCSLRKLTFRQSIYGYDRIHEVWRHQKQVFMVQPRCKHLTAYKEGLSFSRLYTYPIFLPPHPLQWHTAQAMKTTTPTHPDLCPDPCLDPSRAASPVAIPAPRILIKRTQTV